MKITKITTNDFLLSPKTYYNLITNYRNPSFSLGGGILALSSFPHDSPVSKFLDPSLSLPPELYVSEGFDGDTLVQTNLGLRSLRDLSELDTITPKVICSRKNSGGGLYNINGVLSFEVYSSREITYIDADTDLGIDVEYTINCTSTTKFPIRDRYVEARNLKVGDEINNWDSNFLHREPSESSIWGGLSKVSSFIETICRNGYFKTSSPLSEFCENFGIELPVNLLVDEDYQNIRDIQNKIIN